MSMEDVSNKAEEARRVLGQLTKDAEAARKAAKAKLDGLDTEVTHVLTGARVAVGTIEDDRKDVIEKLERFNEVLTGVSPVQTAPVSTPVDDEPNNRPTAQQPTASPVLDESEEDNLLDGLYDSDELTEMSNQDLQRLTNEYMIPFVVTDASRVNAITLIIVQQSAYCQQEGLEDPNGTPSHPTRTLRFRESRTNPRNWRGWQWIGALIGLVVAYLVWTIWPEWAGRNIDNDGVRTFVNFLWCIAHLGLGFFVGAEVVTRIEDNQDN